MVRRISGTRKRSKDQNERTYQEERGDIGECSLRTGKVNASEYEAIVV